MRASVSCMAGGFGPMQRAGRYEGGAQPDRRGTMKIRMLTRIILPAVAAAGLAGCVAADGGAQRIGTVSMQPSAVEGQWVDENGVGVSTFANGVFTTTAMDNGNKLSEGSYVYNGSSMVSINGTSLIRQTPIAFNCSMASRTQLNCTSADGNRFVLTRRA